MRATTKRKAMTPAAPIETYSYSSPGDGYIHRSDGSVMDPATLDSGTVRFFGDKWRITVMTADGRREIPLEEVDRRGWIRWFPKN